jgi:DNA-binding response OmpR family regulator
MFFPSQGSTGILLGYFRCLLGRTRTLDSHASRLRCKLNGASDTAYVLTYVLNVWGVGYRLVATAG